eukprot:TRINITY_DN6368_c0_g1_i1.p1 TRINITY_DN6368_c0_g1~~TRINITY_DN6368_c0_g1_i1.p1  ORF type:complete len:208 (+),score=31.82 TRINITY_DN6368_c0_g1_i1:495-1118(+)
MYFDLNLPLDGTPERGSRQRAILAAAIGLGYDGVASNHIVHGQLTLQEEASTQFPPSETQDLLPPFRLGERKGAFQQVRRITVVVTEDSHANTMNAANRVLQGYDLVAVQPLNQKMFARACTHMEVDIISLDLSRRMAFRLNRLLLAAAMKRGIFFEVSYAPILRDSGAALRQLLTNAQAGQHLLPFLNPPALSHPLTLPSQCAHST